MAKKSVIARERKRRQTVEQYAAKRAALKAEMQRLRASDDFNPADAQALAEKLQKLPRDASPVRLHNRCSLTGRPRGYIRKFGLCRNVFRDLALDGKIPGVRKSSW